MSSLGSVAWAETLMHYHSGVKVLVHVLGSSIRVFTVAPDDNKPYRIGATLL